MCAMTGKQTSASLRPSARLHRYLSWGFAQQQYIVPFLRITVAHALSTSASFNSCTSDVDVHTAGQA